VASDGLDAVIEAAGVETGLRTRADIAARIETLRTDAETAPIAGAEADVLGGILSLKANLPDA
jgi:ATP phosphoribosyltransferase regulatory subunit